MDIKTFNIAMVIKREIDEVQYTIKEINKGFNCTISGTHKNSSEPELVEMCKSIFLREFEKRLNALEKKFKEL